MTRHLNLAAFALIIALAMAVLITAGGAALAQYTPAQPSQPAQPAASTQVKPAIVDDFETGTITNSLGGRTNVYVKAPSKAMISFRKDVRAGRPTTVLMLRYDKKAEGGPYDLGGWCGYYTLLKKAHPSASLLEGASVIEVEEDVYFDASRHNNLTLWVKGEKGNENFVVGLADSHWDKVGDSVKSQEIGKYLPAGKVTAEWQKAVVPLDEFFIDYAKLSSVAIAFEGDCFPEGKGSGTIYIDNIVLE